MHSPFPLCASVSPGLECLEAWVLEDIPETEEPDDDIGNFCAMKKVDSAISVALPNYIDCDIATNMDSPSGSQLPSASCSSSGTGAEERLSTPELYPFSIEPGTVARRRRLFEQGATTSSSPPIANPPLPFTYSGSLCSIRCIQPNSLKSTELTDLASHSNYVARKSPQTTPKRSVAELRKSFERPSPDRVIQKRPTWIRRSRDTSVEEFISDIEKDPLLSPRESQNHRDDTSGNIQDPLEQSGCGSPALHMPSSPSTSPSLLGRASTLEVVVSKVPTLGNYENDSIATAPCDVQEGIGTLDRETSQSRTQTPSLPERGKVGWLRDRINMFEAIGRSGGSVFTRPVAILSHRGSAKQAAAKNEPSAHLESGSGGKVWHRLSTRWHFAASPGVPENREKKGRSSSGSSNGSQTKRSKGARAGRWLVNKASGALYPGRRNAKSNKSSGTEVNRAPVTSTWVADKPGTKTNMTTDTALHSYRTTLHALSRDDSVSNSTLSSSSGNHHIAVHTHEYSITAEPAIEHVQRTYHQSDFTTSPGNSQSYTDPGYNDHSLSPFRGSQNIQKAS